MNQKVRTQRLRYASDMLAAPLPSAKPSRRQIRHLESRSRELEEEISRLECTIAAAPAAMRQHRLATRDTLPAIRPSASRGRPAAGRIPLVQKRAMQKARMSKVIELLIVCGVLAAAVGWLRQWLNG
jgi:hypothetical protein